LCLSQTEEAELLTTLPSAIVVLALRIRAAGPHGSSERAEACEKFLAALQPANDAAADLFVAGAHQDWPVEVSSALWGMITVPILAVHNSMPMPYGAAFDRFSLCFKCNSRHIEGLLMTFS